ncbi:MAG: LpxL/LpxP family Kdo(2)-lipid IV(A) lauroyl/palmitoleoyl acyltransferase [Agarilytica sp.]
MSQEYKRKDLFHPRWVPSWIAFALWWLIVQLLPYKLQMKIGAGLGIVAKKLVKNRTIVAKKNIDLCFPEKTEEEKNALLNASMINIGKGFMESGIAWFWPAWRLKKLYRINGLEYLQKAKQEGQGVIYMAIHFTPIEICAAFINLSYSIDGFYRPHANAVYEFIQGWGRIRHNSHSQVIPSRDTRGIIKALRQKRVVNYAADHDYGRSHSVFVPFFGVEAATVTAPAKLAKMGRAQVIPYATKRLEKDAGYVIDIYPPLEGLDEGDEIANANLINRFIEARIRENPEQYLWVHRRFKSRPDRNKDFYGLKKAKA